MAASFGWDWGLAAPSMGIWKDVHLEIYDSALVRHVTHHLIDSNDDFWILKLFVHMETGLKKVNVNGVIICELR